MNQGRVEAERGTSRDSGPDKREGFGAAPAPAPTHGLTIPEWFQPQFSDPRLAQAYQLGRDPRFRHGFRFNSHVQQAQSQALQQWTNYLQRNIARSPQAAPSAPAAPSEMPPLNLSDNVAGLSSYGVTTPSYRKSAGYAGAPRPMPMPFAKP